MKMPVNPPVTAPIPRGQLRTREFIEKSQAAMVESIAWECCLNCEHWTEKHIVQVPDETRYSGYREEDQGPRCIKWGIRPPTKTIIIGCADYEPGIPF